MGLQPDDTPLASCPNSNPLLKLKSTPRGSPAQRFWRAGTNQARKSPRRVPGPPWLTVWATKIRAARGAGVSANRAVRMRQGMKSPNAGTFRRAPPRPAGSHKPRPRPASSVLHWTRGVARGSPVPAAPNRSPEVRREAGPGRSLQARGARGSSGGVGVRLWRPPQSRSGDQGPRVGKPPRRRSGSPLTRESPPLTPPAAPSLRVPPSPRARGAEPGTPSPGPRLT